MYPDTDFDLKRSRCSGGMDRSDPNTSWKPQLALVNAHSLFGGRGELSKADISFYFSIGT